MNSKQQNQQMPKISRWEKLPSLAVINKTVEALKKNGIDTYFVQTEDEARKKVFEIIPKGAEVLTMTSVTLDTLGISKEINEPGKFNSVRNKLNSMDRKTQAKEMQRFGTAPEYVLGSVHAVTEDGKVLIASATGSQLPAYAYGAMKVIWVVGVQKIVKDLDEAMIRIYEHTFNLENERAKKIYGVGSNVSKLLLFNREYQEGRIKIIFVNKILGF
jgi:hypothetical protein